MAILNDMMSPKVRSPEDAERRARAENVLMEERVGSARWGRYETEFPPVAATYDDWLDSHNEYLNDAVLIDVPETFLAANRDAALPPAVTSEVGEGQVLVRVESLDYALTHTNVVSLDQMMILMAIHKGQKDDRISSADAKALLGEVCDSLNRNDRAIRPRFAAFGQELEADIAAPDWTERLRDRLGLAHLPPADKFGPHPVALMRYTVAEVTKRASRVGAIHPLTVPTVLDAEPNGIFHPSPREVDYGRTLNLTGAGDCDRLASEVLHLRIDYQPSHIWKVGAIMTRAEISPEKLAELRGNHLICLQLLSGRDDFGRL